VLYIFCLPEQSRLRRAASGARKEGNALETLDTQLEAGVFFLFGFVVTH
jgi:hypothetical protein